MYNYHINIKKYAADVKRKNEILAKNNEYCSGIIIQNEFDIKQMREQNRLFNNKIAKLRKELMESKSKHTSLITELNNRECRLNALR